jgi:hypothetical protein
MDEDRVNTGAIAIILWKRLLFPLNLIFTLILLLSQFLAEELGLLVRNNELFGPNLLWAIASPMHSFGTEMCRS